MVLVDFIKNITAGLFCAGYDFTTFYIIKPIQKLISLATSTNILGKAGEITQYFSGYLAPVGFTRASVLPVIVGGIIYYLSYDFSPDVKVVIFWSSYYLFVCLYGLY